MNEALDTETIPDFKMTISYMDFTDGCEDFYTTFGPKVTHIEFEPKFDYEKLKGRDFLQYFPNVKELKFEGVQNQWIFNVFHTLPRYLKRLRIMYKAHLPMSNYVIEFIDRAIKTTNLKEVDIFAIDLNSIGKQIYQNFNGVFTHAVPLNNETDWKPF